MDDSDGVAASGDGPLTYQWKKDGGDIAGATTATYTITSATSASAGTLSPFFHWDLFLS